VAYLRPEDEEPDVELGVLLLVPVEEVPEPDVPVVEPVEPLLIEPEEPVVPEVVPVEPVEPVAALPDVPEVSEPVADVVLVSELLRVPLLQPVTPNPARASAARSVMLSRFVFMRVIVIVMVIVRTVADSAVLRGGMVVRAREPCPVRVQVPHLPDNRVRQDRSDWETGPRSRRGLRRGPGFEVVPNPRTEFRPMVEARAPGYARRMNSRTAADACVALLLEWGVDTIFGLPGDGINGIMEALRKQRERVHFIQVRHEEAAALAAVGYAKFTGRLGVCLATTGPGAVHLLNGLYDAKADQMPVLAITGLPYHDLVGTCYQQDVATDRLFADVACFSERIMGPAHVESVVNQAVRLALSRRTVTHIAFPNDFQELPADDDEPSQMNQPGHTAATWEPARIVPTPAELKRAAGIVNAGHQIAIVLGSGARGARTEIEELARRLNAPVAKALLGKDVLPDESPFTTGTIGVFGTSATSAVMAQADTLLLIGTSFPYIKYLPDPKKVRGVQIDVNPERIALRFPVEVGLVGDARETLRLLLPLLEARTDTRLLDLARAKMREWWALMERRATSPDLPMRPQAVAWELGKQLRDDAIICGDSGQNTLYAARHIKMRGAQRFSCSGLLATMGSALPYAVAAQVAFPQRQVIAFAGDGGLTMMLGELATCKKHGLPIKVFVLKNNTLGMIRWEQMMFLGNPEYGTELENVDFAKVAEAFGLKAFHVERPDDLPKIVAEALAHDGPALVEAVVDPDEPLMPGQIKPEQAEHYAEALRRGQPNARRIALTLFRDAIEDLGENRPTLEQALEKKVPALAQQAKKEKGE
jgi:pyruvate dehydrogenase (quinone)